MQNELFDFIRLAFLAEKADELISTLILFEELSLADCQDQCLAIITSRGDSAINETATELEDLIREYLFTAIREQGIYLNENTYCETELLVTLVSIPNAILAFEDKEALDVIVEDLENSGTEETLLQLAKVVSKVEISEHDFFEIVDEVPATTMEAIVEIIERGEKPEEAVSSGSFERVKRWLTKHEVNQDGPVHRHLNNGGSLGLSIVSLEIHLGDAIASIVDLKDRAKEIVYASLISSAELDKVKESALYMARGAVDSIEEEASLNSFISHLIEEFLIESSI